MRRYRIHGEGSRDADAQHFAAVPDLRQAGDNAASAFLLGALHPNRSRALAEGELQRPHRRAAGGHAGGGRARALVAGLSCALRARQKLLRRKGGKDEPGGSASYKLSRLAPSPARADDLPRLGLALRAEQALAGAISSEAMAGARDPAAVMRPAERIRVGGQFDQIHDIRRRNEFGRGHWLWDSKVSGQAFLNIPRTYKIG